MKRKRNGRFVSRRPRRLRPKLTKHDRRVVRAAVRTVSRREETKRLVKVVGGISPSSWQPFTNGSGDWSGDYRFSHTWFSNALDGVVQGDLDSQIQGSSIYIKSFVFDFTFFRSALNGTVTYPMPIWYRLDLVRSSKAVLSNGGWTANVDTDPTALPFFDGTTTGTNYLWSPGSYIDRRTFKSPKSVTGKLPTCPGLLTQDNSSAFVDNIGTQKRLYCKVRINKKVQFDTPIIDTIGTSYQLKTYNYAWVLSFYIPYYVPSTYSATFKPVTCVGATYCYYKDD